MNNKKHHIDYEIQEALDAMKRSTRSEPVAMHKELELYEELYKKLEEPPVNALGEDFTVSVIAAARKRKRMVDIKWKIALYISVTTLFVGLSVIVAMAMNPEVFWKAIATLRQNVTFIAFGFAVFAVIQVLDMKLVKNKLPNVRA